MTDPDPNMDDVTVVDGPAPGTDPVDPQPVLLNENGSQVQWNHPDYDKAANDGATVDPDNETDDQRLGGTVNRGADGSHTDGNVTNDN